MGLIPNPWVILGAVLFLIATAASSYLYGEHVGAVTERGAWQKKENAEITNRANRIKDLEDKAREEEASHATQLAAIGAQHEKELQDAEERRRHDVDDAHSGALRLRIAGACPVHADGGSATAPAAAAPQRDDPTTGELPGPVAADLLALADDADQVARELAACQAVVLSDRNPEPSK